MRAGICSIQLQALTPEAASVVKQAVSLATRRGHAQVTPLHVASAMLAPATTTASSGLLRRACLQCHSHPLQCKALELCFNVALNRLPASTPTPLLGPHYAAASNGISGNAPSLSNALVAAFKRAQSHQRRGSIEAQNQSILALKIEVEQLVISILDDPSVSRVMREAGFSSTIVKSKVEQYNSNSNSNNSCDQISSQTPTTTKPNIMKHHCKGKDHGGGGGDEVASVVELVLNRRRNVVIVGESVGSGEGLARGVMERVVNSSGVEVVCFRNKEEVERKIVELRKIIVGGRGRGRGRGVVLYLGDLEWLVEMFSYYNHMVMEVKRLVSEEENVCLLGVASFKTYIKCKTCQPSLETLWDLHPFTIPLPTLSLTFNINCNSEMKSGERCYYEDRGGVRKNLSCCTDCTVKFEKEAQTIITINNSMPKKDYCTPPIVSSSTSNPTLPSWLLNYQESERVKDLCKKWNSFCNFQRHPHHKNLMISPPSSSKLECELLYREEARNNVEEEEEEENDVVCSKDNNNNLIMFMPEPDTTTRPDLLSNPNSSPNSASSSEADLDGLDTSHVFKDPTQENLEILCDALDNKVGPRHKHVLREISSTVLHCRSGKKIDHSRQDTWMVFTCNDGEGEQVSRELAKAVFGSYANFVMISGSSSSSCLLDDNDKKRVRSSKDEVERFGEALNENPHRVFFLEGMDGISHKSVIYKEAIRSGSLRFNNGDEVVPLKDAIVIFCIDDAINDNDDDDECNLIELVDKHIVFRTQELGDIN
ncbi:protein SMAX1-LIKE 3-like [Senna tora]|uniref:Protein SMAX1-LIKE 3-like n=1 Tax=Senna tora TaxID=362788 RepID=A0A834WF79_9FABA|nr:protein SMAX1-LIKE 3-like [Senna tora]